MIKQVVFFKKRPDMTLEKFIDYYENQHSRLAKRIGKPAIPNAVRYVRRYITPEKNPVTGQIHDCGYDCIMEIWWNTREDFENSLRLVGDPERLPHTVEDEKKLFATHANPVCTVEERDSPVGPDNLIYDWLPRARERQT
jgi:EthD domain